MRKKFVSPLREIHLNSYIEDGDRLVLDPVMVECVDQAFNDETLRFLKNLRKETKIYTPIFYDEESRPTYALCKVSDKNNRMNGVIFAFKRKREIIEYIELLGTMTHSVVGWAELNYIDFVREMHALNVPLLRQGQYLCVALTELKADKDILIRDIIWDGLAS